MPADEESYGRTAVPNPYRGLGPNHHNSLGNRAVDLLKRLIYLGISGYCLHRMNFVGAILRSPHVQREWFKVGLAGTIALLGLKAYIELYEGRIRKQTVNYAHYKNETHLGIALILLCSLAFHIALWPYYRWNTPIALGLCFFGVILQFLLIVPVWLQNLVAFVGLTFFLQEYQ